MIDRLTEALSDRYTIERELGAGGMATVYLAADLKHDRNVALKVLKPELAAVVGADRFLAEIKTTANLQHPHILPLFDSGEADGFLWYAMPYVEGESLRDRIDREKQLPVAEAVAIATKVLGALEAAHARGIIHRDIKPANILVDAQGEPLVADFGIALAVQEAGAGRLTETGLSLGTPYYMSPEQATGDRDPDARSDLYSVGAALYEMLVGEPPFVGSTAQSVLGKILTGEVTRPTATRKSIPGNVEAAVMTSLERLPADRFGSAGEFSRALADGGFGGARAAVSAAGKAGSGATPWITAAAVGVVAFVGGWFASAPPVPVGQGEFVAELGVQANPMGGLALTPDGGVVFQDPETPLNEVLLLRSPESSIPRVVRAGDLSDPVASPDGRFIAYSAVDSLFRLDLETDQVVLLGATPVDRDVFVARTPEFWTDDGLYVLEQEFNGPRGKRLVRYVDGAQEAEEVMDFTDWPFVMSRWGPGPNGLLFGAAHRLRVTYVGDTTRILAIEPESGDTTLVVPQGAHPNWVDTGHLVYLDPSGEIMALPFDPSELRATAPAFSLGLSTDGWTVAWPLMDVRDDRLTYLANTVEPSGQSSFEWFDPMTGESEALRLPTGGYNFYRLSPDGRRLVLRDGIGTTPKRVENLATGARVLLEGEDFLNDSPAERVGFPVWSPDSESLAWMNRVGDLVVATGSDFSDRRSFSLGLVEEAREGQVQISIWPAADLIIVNVFSATDFRTRAVRVRLREGVWAVEPYDAPWRERIHAISPDQRWVVVEETFDGSQTRELWLRPWPSLEGGLRLASDEEDIRGRWGDSRWTNGGRTLVYALYDSIVIADVSTANGEPALLNRRAIDPTAFEAWGFYDLEVGPDGRLLVTPSADLQTDLEPHERNRVMLLTGLRERIRRMDPANAGGN